ncbi:hypothetical protein ACFVXG_37705 [Kitasatospora sp. NPDC058162]|uniref:hypothetical protein n=1 Tax=Kitasatospora sp. NPDC058162 TaxID=3346362 RepID=UPI0036DBDF31
MTPEAFAELGGHWHGYGPWVGQRRLMDLEYLRRPEPFDIQELRVPSGMSAHPQETFIPFSQRTIPPMMTGHYLLRRPEDLEQRTWTAASPAVDWLTSIYKEHPPMQRADGKRAYATLEWYQECAHRSLLHGSDVVWSHYLDDRRFMSSAVICCPSLPFHPGIKCPLP